MNGGIPERCWPLETIIINIAKTETIEISVWIMYKYLASEGKKGCGFYLLWERHGSIIVCRLCAQVASLQRSTLNISNWKTISF